MCFFTFKELNLIFAHHFFSPPKGKPHPKKPGLVFVFINKLTALGFSSKNEQKIYKTRDLKKKNPKSFFKKRTNKNNTKLENIGKYHYFRRLDGWVSRVSSGTSHRKPAVKSIGAGAGVDFFGLYVAIRGTLTRELGEFSGTLSEKKVSVSRNVKNIGKAKANPGTLNNQFWNGCLVKQISK